MKSYVFIKRGEAIPRGSQVWHCGKWVSYWNRENAYTHGIANLIFNFGEIRRPLKYRESLKPTNNIPVTKLLCRCVKYIEGVSGRSVKGDKLLKDLYAVVAQLRNRQDVACH